VEEAPLESALRSIKPQTVDIDRGAQTRDAWVRSSPLQELTNRTHVEYALQLRSVAGAVKNCARGSGSEGEESRRDAGRRDAFHLDTVSRLQARGAMSMNAGTGD
jgi:hypothetical protein